MKIKLKDLIKEETSQENKKIINSIKRYRRIGDIEISRNRYLSPSTKKKVNDLLKKINWKELSSNDNDFLERTESWLTN